MTGSTKYRLADKVTSSVFMRNLILAILTALPALAQTSSTDWAVHAANQYRVISDVTYLTASNVELKLDVYQRADVATPQPTVIHMHGGFWVAGTKEGSIMALMPWFEMGWNVVNVEYRLGRQALAPAAVEDCMCALRFVNNQAKTYNIDPTRLVVTGESAGGHLALSLGMIPESRHDGAVPGSSALTRSVDQSRHAQSIADDPGRQARRFHAGGADKDLRSHPRVSG